MQFVNEYKVCTSVVAGNFLNYYHSTAGIHFVLRGLISDLSKECDYYYSWTCIYHKLSGNSLDV